MSTATKPRAATNARAIKASTDAQKAAQAADAKVEATRIAQAAKVAAEATSQAEEAAEEMGAEALVSPANVSDVQAFHVNAYRNAEHAAGQSKHAANVSAVAFFRTLPETVKVTTSKSSTVKPVSARERAERTLEALCVRVERGPSGKVTKGLDSIGLTVQRVTQLVEAFRNAEVALTSLKVEEHAQALASEDPEQVAKVETEARQVEALVSALDQARVVAGTKAAAALASSVRESVEEASEVDFKIESEEGPAVVSTPEQVAVESAREGVKGMRAGKTEQTKETGVVKTASQKISDSVQALWDAIEANATDLDAGQKSALVSKIETLHAHALKFLA